MAHSRLSSGKFSYIRAELRYLDVNPIYTTSVDAHYVKSQDPLPLSLG
jgi:hypothetical protein